MIAFIDADRIGSEVNNGASASLPYINRYARGSASSMAGVADFNSKWHIACDLELAIPRWTPGEPSSPTTPFRTIAPRPRRRLNLSSKPRR